MALHDQEREPYQLILFRMSSNEILLSDESSQIALPTISIPRYVRPAEWVVEALNRLLNIQGYCLFTTAQESESNCARRFAVASTLSDKSIPPGGFRWFAAQRLADEARLDAPTVAIVKQVLEGSQGENEFEKGFFARPGWLAEIMTWADEQISPFGFYLTRKFAQLNASPTFSLLRLETNGPAVWLKAVGQPNLQEFFISREVARLFPQFVPRIIGAREDCKAWLTLEVPGNHPDKESGATVWEGIAETLARLEIASLGRALHLINAGFRDSRLCTLGDLVAPFVDVVGALMERQPRDQPKPMSRTELQTLAAQMKESVFAFGNLSLPNVLVHLDFNPGNILVSDSGRVFLDWAEAAAGPCFLTLQYLREHIRQLQPRDSAAESRAISAYVKAWSAFLDPASVRGALSLSPLVALIVYALSGTEWRRENVRSEHRTASHLRSLARRMKKEVDLAERAMACRS